MCYKFLDVFCFQFVWRCVFLWCWLVGWLGFFSKYYLISIVPAIEVEANNNFLKRLLLIACILAFRDIFFYLMFLMMPVHFQKYRRSALFIPKLTFICANYYLMCFYVPSMLKICHCFWFFFQTRTIVLLSLWLHILHVSWKNSSCILHACVFVCIYTICTCIIIIWRFCFKLLSLDHYLR